MKKSFYAIVVLTFAIYSCKTDNKVESKLITKGPIAKIIPDTLSIHNDTGLTTIDGCD